MPTEMAATLSLSGFDFAGMCLCSRAHSMASCSAMYAPVIAAVRVPPSACKTSQSITMVFSPSSRTSTMARRLRPIRREISWVRPPILPLTASRSLRVWVARGNMAYSAVTQPSPLPTFQRGTPLVNDAVQSTLVPPNVINADPSACSLQPRSMVTLRSWSGVRPSARTVMMLLFL